LYAEYDDLVKSIKKEFKLKVEEVTQKCNRLLKE